MTKLQTENILIVDINSSKTEIRTMEKLFGVKVESVNTLRQKEN